MVEATVKRIHELMTALLRRTINVGNEEDTETEISEFVNQVGELRTQLLAQMTELTTKTSAGLYAVENANIMRVLNRIS